MTKTSLRRMLPVILTLVPFGCQVSEPPSTQPPPAIEAVKPAGADTLESPNSEALKGIESLAMDLRKSKFQRALYQKSLRQISRDPRAKKALGTLRLDAFDDPYMMTALAYLKGLQNPGRLIPKSPRKTMMKRTPSLLEHTSELCATSHQFAIRVREVFGRASESFCLVPEASSSFQFNHKDLSSFLTQTLNTQSATVARGVLLLSSIDHPSSGKALLSLPAFNLGQPSKVMGKLRPLQLGIVLWSASAKNREYLASLVKEKDLEPRVFRRAILALAWHQDPAARPQLPQLFMTEPNSAENVSNAVLRSILRHLKDRGTLETVVRTIYQQPTLSVDLLTDVPPDRLPPLFIAALNTESLVNSPAHAKAWISLKDSKQVKLVDWQRVFDANSDKEKTAILLRNLSHIQGSLPHPACEALKSLVFQDAEDHTRDALITTLHRAQCLTNQELEAESKRGTRSAIILMGNQSPNPNAYFHSQIASLQRSKAARACEALIRHPKLVKALEPKAKFATALSKHLKTTKDSFPFLRLLTMMVKRSEPQSFKKVEKGLIKTLSPYIDGTAGGIHSDALVILESLNSPKSLAVVLKVLKGLEKGTTKNRLMLRFGHLLPRKSK